MRYLPPLPVAIPLAVAAVLMALSARWPRRLRDSLAIATAVAVAVVCGLLLNESLAGPVITWFGGWTPRHGIAVGIAFAIDPLGAGLALLVAVLVTASLVFTWYYFDEAGPLFPTLMLTFLGAMTGFCLTGDLFNLFVFFELMSVAAYALTAHKIEEEQALMGAFHFAVTNSVGAFLVLAGIALVYGRTGALNLAQIGQTLTPGPADGLVLTAFVLISAGFGVKAALVPFQFWLADAHAVAPAPVCVLFSGVMVELGLYGVARVYWTAFAGVLEVHAPVIREVWVGMGVLTAVVGAVMCIGQRHLKRLLAFSTISHTGMFLLGLAFLTPDGLAGAALGVVGHGLVKGALFLSAGILLNRFASVDENRLRGRGRIFPGLGVVFVCAGLGLSGLPPFANWRGKSLMEETAKQMGYGWIPAILLFAAAVTGAAVLRAAGAVFLGLGTDENRDAGTPEHEDRETDEDYDDPPAVMFVPAAVLVVLALAAGLWGDLEHGTRQASVRFLDRPAYAAAVLEGHPRPVPPPKPAGPKLPGILYGLGSAGGAVLLAALGLFKKHLPRRACRVAGSVGDLVLRPLRSLHSGQIGDYVTWIVVGVASLGGLFAWLIRP